MKAKDMQYDLNDYISNNDSSKGLNKSRKE